MADKIGAERAGEAKERRLSQSRLKEVLSYDPLTGVFARKKSAKSRVGHVAARGYLMIKIDNSTYFAHRLVWLYMNGEWPDEIDHSNGNKTDNRFSNLRLATRAQNCWNRPVRSDNLLGLKGVRKYTRRHVYGASISIEGKKVHLGCFRDAISAHEAYCAAAEKYYGSFARRG